MPHRQETFAVRAYCHPLSREVVISGSALLEPCHPAEATFRLKCSRNHSCPLVFAERSDAVPPCLRVRSAQSILETTLPSRALV